MAMKKAELEKQMGLKIGQRKGPETGARFGQLASSGAPDRREQRRLDAAAGLVPFACKLPSALAAQLTERAAKHEGGLNGLMAELVKKGLGA
jgi:hypothetical protein